MLLEMHGYLATCSIRVNSNKIKSVQEIVTKRETKANDAMKQQYDSKGSNKKI